MGILCTCNQPVIYSKEQHLEELEDKINQPKKEFTNKSTTLKSKFFTKDTTLLNHSNDNSPNKDELLLKNKLTELEIPTNQKTKNKHIENIKKNKTDIKSKVSFNSPGYRKIKKRENKTYSNNNIHVMKNCSNLIIRNSVPITTPIINDLTLSDDIKLYNSSLQKSNSFNFEKHPVKQFLELINTNNSIKASKKKSNKTAGKLKKRDKNFKMAYSIKTSMDQENIITTGLNQHFMFMNFTKKSLEEIIDYMNIFNYNDEEIIFGKGEVANNFYIIKKGVVLLMSDGKIFKKLTTGDTFGEIALFQNESIIKNIDVDDNMSTNDNEILTRNYTAISKGKTKLYALKYSSYNSAIKSIKKNKEIKTVTNMEEELDEKNKELIKSYKFFRYLNEHYINIIEKKKKKYEFPKKGNLLSITNYNIKISNNFLVNKKPFFKSKQNLLLIINGMVKRTIFANRLKVKE